MRICDVLLNFFVSVNKDCREYYYTEHHFHDLAERCQTTYKIRWEDVLFDFLIVVLTKRYHGLVYFDLKLLSKIIKHIF